MKGERKINNSRGSYNIKLSNVTKKVNSEQYQNFKAKSQEFGLNDDNYVFATISTTHPIQNNIEQMAELQLVLEKIDFNCLYVVKWDDRGNGYYMHIICNIGELDNVSFEYTINEKKKNHNLESALVGITKEPTRYAISTTKFGFCTSVIKNEQGEILSKTENLG